MFVGCQTNPKIKQKKTPFKKFWHTLKPERTDFFSIGRLLGQTEKGLSLGAFLFIGRKWEREVTGWKWCVWLTIYRTHEELYVDNPDGLLAKLLCLSVSHFLPKC